MPARYLLIAGMFLLSMLLYVDRVCISTAKDAVALELTFSDRQMGWVFAAFSLGYALFQTPSGILADRFGPHRVLTMVVCFWSLFTAMTAGARGLAGMLAVRFLFGAGGGGGLSGHGATYLWLPISRAQDSHRGSTSRLRRWAHLAMPGITWLVGRVGWQASFVVLGVVGFVWLLPGTFGFVTTPASTHGYPRGSGD